MLTLYHAPRSRSSRILWLLEELGADYHVDYVDIVRTAVSPGGAPDPRNPHPLKQVPALRMDGVVIVESIMIILALTDRYPGLAPTVGEPKRTEYLSWLGFYNGVLEPVVAARFRGETTAVQKDAFAELDRRWRAALDEGPYLLGEHFTAVDILFGSLLQFYRGAVPEYPVYDEYLARISARPALARAQSKDDRPHG
jgi:glutathione S-transferase